MLWNAQSVPRPGLLPTDLNAPLPAHFTPMAHDYRAAPALDAGNIHSKGRLFTEGTDKLFNAWNIMESRKGRDRSVATLLGVAKMYPVEIPRSVSHLQMAHSGTDKVLVHIRGYRNHH